MSEFEVHLAKPSDIREWLGLAETVEYLFGPMIGHGFEEALAANISRESAFCVKKKSRSSPLCGGLLFEGREQPTYHIRWLAVLRSLRQRGIGRLLLSHAIALARPPCRIEVVTFGPDNPEGSAARRLYETFGFKPDVMPD